MLPLHMAHFLNSASAGKELYVEHGGDGQMSHPEASLSQYPLVSENMAMENGPFIGDVPINTSIQNEDFPWNIVIFYPAMFDETRGYLKLRMRHGSRRHG